MHEFVAFVEGIGLILEFLICLIITSALCKVIQQQSISIYEIILEIIPNEISILKLIIISICSIISWSISSIIVIGWIIYRYPNLVLTPTNPITPWFGMNQINKIFSSSSSKSVLFITIILSKKKKNTKNKRFIKFLSFFLFFIYF